MQVTSILIVLNCRVESTRDMCNLLKNFAANVGERIDQCEWMLNLCDSTDELHETLNSYCVILV